MKKFILIIICVLQLHLAHAEVKSVDIHELKATVNENKNKKILFFFVSWCEPCIQTIKDISAKNITFISFDEEQENIHSLAKNIQYDIYHVLPSEEHDNIHELSQALGVKIAIRNTDGSTSISYPHIALLDEKNEVLIDNIKKEDLNKYLK